MRQFLITAMSAVLAHAKGTMLAVLFLGCLAGKSQGASIVRVTYIQNDQKVGAGIYTGSDGGAGSEPTGYWALIAGPPEIVPDDVTIVPDKENGRVATLKGKIHISLTIRNSINMGIVELDSLRLIRNGAKSKGWYVPADEYRRIQDIVRKRLKDTITVEYVKGYSTLAQVVYTVPDDADPSRLTAYWAVLGSAPKVVDRIKFKPDTPDGKTATLRGEIKIKLGPRPYVKLGGNSRYPGQVELDPLKLVRDHADSDKWRLPKDELQRVLGLVGAGGSQSPHTDVPPREVGVVPVEPKEDPKTGFVVGGRNESEFIKSLTHINGIAISELEKSMRPEGLSKAGFLGKDECLLDVMAADNEWVLKSGSTHQELARHLRVLARIARMESEPFIESEVFTYRGVRFKTKLFVTDGFQESPFKDGTKTNSDMIIVNVDNGEALSYSLLVPLMIERYGFYEGRGTPYRVDPSKVMEVLTFLEPNKK